MRLLIEDGGPALVSEACGELVCRQAVNIVAHRLLPFRCSGPVLGTVVCCSEMSLLARKAFEQSDRGNYTLIYVPDQTKLGSRLENAVDLCERFLSCEPERAIYQT